MDAQSLPIVPFGKYKGQPITTLINDTKYLEWCKQQEWFQKFPIVYNICINQQISQNNPNSKTPEHNKLQNLFLEEENVKTLLKHVNKQSKNVYSEIGICKVEGIYNWDLTVEDSNWWLCSCDWDIEDKNCCDCETFKKFIEKYKIPNSVGQGGCVSYHNYYCEIKPLLGDDYPCVLRKMKQQIELTNNYADKENEETKKKTDCFLSHNWGDNNLNHKKIATINSALQKRGLVTWFDENTPALLIEYLKPNVLVKGGDYNKEDVVGYDVLKSYNLKIFL